VGKKIGLQFSSYDIEKVVASTPQHIERLLRMVQLHVSGREEHRPETATRRSAKAAPQERKATEEGSSLKTVLEEKEKTIRELNETIEIMEIKVQKMDQLLKLKDSKIQSLIKRLTEAGLK
jgi:hypothetical protein